MVRTYADFITASDDAKAQLNQLADKATLPADYRAAMTTLGERLGTLVSTKIKSTREDSQPSVYLACTVEDADYLAKGMLTSLEQHLQSVSLACFWNERFSPFGVTGLKASPILRKYQEPTPRNVSHLIIVKSIISSGCVVKTNLTNLIQNLNPKTIYIVAPVIYTGAEKRLSAAFPKAISQKFQFLYLASDDQRTPAGEVIPGIGGMVYERLGFNNQAEKNRYVPELVKTRRSQLVAS